MGENQGCFPIGEGLSLVEEVAQEYSPAEKEHPQEKPTEHITRLIDTKELLRELWESRKREAALKSELDYARKQYGGKKMGIGGKLLVAGTFLAASYFGINMALAHDKAEQLKRDMFTASELVEFDTLKTELGSQLQAASAYLDRAKAAEEDYRQFAMDAVAYIKNSTPPGELEDEAAQKINDLTSFFENDNIESIIGQIEQCRSAHGQARVLGSTKSGLQAALSNANSECAAGYDKIARHSGDVVDSLVGFREYVNSHPLKSRAEMLARITQQMEERSRMFDEGTHYSGMFANNNMSQDVIPVMPQEGYNVPLPE